MLNTLIEVEITQQTIVFRKPWKRYSLFFRKRRTIWTLSNDEWTDAYIFSAKSSYSIYFRKDRTAAFIASIEEGRKIIKEIEAFFPDKKVHYNFPFEYPKEIRKKLKKQYPERVMRG
jgi:hypothetical protein